jgi:hypothetical protein
MRRSADRISRARVKRQRILVGSRSACGAGEDVAIVLELSDAFSRLVEIDPGGERALCSLQSRSTKRIDGVLLIDQFGALVDEQGRRNGGTGLWGRRKFFHGPEKRKQRQFRILARRLQVSMVPLRLGSPVEEDT